MEPGDRGKGVEPLTRAGMYAAPQSTGKNDGAIIPALLIVRNSSPVLVCYNAFT